VTDCERSLTPSREALLQGVTQARASRMPLGEWGTAVTGMRVRVSDWTFPPCRIEACVCTDMCTAMRTGRSDLHRFMGAIERERHGPESGVPAQECKVPLRDRVAPVAPTGTLAPDCVTPVYEKPEPPCAWTRLDS
jgi:hypothetical protein